MTNKKETMQPSLNPKFSFSTQTRYRNHEMFLPDIKPSLSFCLKLSKILLLVTLLLSWSTGISAKKKSPVIQAMDLTYGIYLSGVKVGWMRTQIKVKDSIEFHTNLNASVGGMGQVAQISLNEKRSYDQQSGRLLSLDFSQQAATGQVKVQGHAESDHFKLEITAGRAKQQQIIDTTETYTDILAMEQLARKARKGAQAKSIRFDPSLQKVLNIHHKILRIEERVFGGVQVRAVEIESSYPELGIQEVSWLDDTGKVLESKIGGFFVARLEPPDVARQLDYQQDLLISAVVPSPENIINASSRKEMQIRIKGFGTVLPPSSNRQKVQSTASHVEITIQRQTLSSTSTYPWAVDQEENKKYLQATPFIQSNAIQIKTAAQKAVGNAHDARTALTRLVKFVASHIKDEYVPAYSNALDALRTGRGDCTEHSVLFVALARSLGIPAREVVGIAYWPPGEGFGWHAWAEVNVLGQWYSLDPTWNQLLSDVTHIKLADGGPAQQARIVMLLGQLKVMRLKLQ